MILRDKDWKVLARRYQAFTTSFRSSVAARRNSFRSRRSVLAIASGREI